MTQMVEALSLVVTNPIFSTVVSGTLVFVISNYIMEIVIKPRLSLKKKLATLSELFLKYQSKITNNTLGKETIIMLKENVSGIVSESWCIYRNKKKRMKYLEIARLVNGIVGFRDSETDMCIEINRSINELAVIDKRLIIAYGKPFLANR